MPGPEKRVKTAVLRGKSNAAGMVAAQSSTDPEGDLRQYFLTLIRQRLTNAQDRTAAERILGGEAGTTWQDVSMPIRAQDERRLRALLYENMLPPALERDLANWQTSETRRALPYVPPAPPFRGESLEPLQLERDASDPYQRLMRIVPELRGIAAKTSYAPATETPLFDMSDRRATDIQDYGIGGEYDPNTHSIWINPLFSGTVSTGIGQRRMRQTWAGQESNDKTIPLQLTGGKLPTLSDLGFKTTAHEYAHALDPLIPFTVSAEHPVHRVLGKKIGTYVTPAFDSPRNLGQLKWDAHNQTIQDISRLATHAAAKTSRPSRAEAPTAERERDRQARIQTLIDKLRAAGAVRR